MTESVHPLPATLLEPSREPREPLPQTGPALRAVPSSPTTSSTWIPRYRRWAVLLDVLAALTGSTIALLVGRELGLGLFSPAQVTVIAVLAPVLWVLALLQAGTYERRVLGVGPDEYGRMPRAAVGLLAVAAVISAVVYDSWPTSYRLFPVAALPVALAGSLVLRYVLRQRLHRSRLHSGAAMQRAVIVGCHESVVELVDDMRRDPSHGLLPVAACSSSPRSPIPGLALEGPPETALATIAQARADVVVVAHPSELTSQELRRLSWDLEERGVELMVSPGIMEVAGPRLSIRPSASLTLVHVESPTADMGTLAGKVIFDRVMAVLLTLVTLPLVLLIAAAIKVNSRGPILFLQTRVGARGESFRMIKFRSMVVDAEERLAQVRDEADHGNGRLFKRHDDPRVTRVGRVLRRYSLDELPQLWNVALGDMSLVGPRPPLQAEVATYEADAIRRLRVRPGLTGLWQVSGRSDLSWDESLRLDLRYVDNWSLMLDLQILWRTARAVLKGEGAY